MKNRIISLLFAFGLVLGCSAPKQTTENPKPANIEGLAEKGSPAHSGQARHEEQQIPLTAPKEERVPGALEFYQQKSVLLAPTIVQANRDFEIKFNTFGGGCEREGDEDVTVSESAATVKVYDFTVGGPGVNCASILRSLPHTVTLRFTKPGEATIKIEGIRQGNDTPFKSGAGIVLEHRLTVKEAEIK